MNNEQQAHEPTGATGDQEPAGVHATARAERHAGTIATAEIFGGALLDVWARWKQMGTVVEVYVPTDEGPDQVVS